MTILAPSTTTSKSRCSAKDPATCRFHGTPVVRAPKEEPTYDKYGQRVRSHSNVDKFERTTRELLCLPTNSVERAAYLKELHALPEMEKPIAYRDLSEKELSVELDKIRKLMEEINGQPLDIMTTHNNQEDYDFYDRNTKQLFELKLGEQTNANNGVGLMDWALATKGNELAESFRAAMNERINMWDDGHKRRRSLVRLADDLLNHRIRSAGTALGVISMNAYRPEAKQRLSHVARCYNYGITRQKDMEASYKRYQEYQKNPHKYKFANEQELVAHIYGKTLPHLIKVGKDKNVSIIENNSKSPTEQFEMTLCELTNKGQGIRLKFRGKQSGSEIQIIQGFKNNLHRTGKSDIPARFGVTSPAFYAWVYPPKP